MKPEEYIEELSKIMETFKKEVYQPLILLTNRYTLNNPKKADTENFKKEVIDKTSTMTTLIGVMVDKIDGICMTTYEDYQKSLLKKLKDVLGLRLI